MVPHVDFSTYIVDWVDHYGWERKGILCWGFLCVNKEAFKTSKGTLCCCLENKNVCNCCKFQAVLENHKHRFQQEKAKMNHFKKILCDKHMPQELYDLSEFVLMPERCSACRSPKKTFNARACKLVHTQWIWDWNFAKIQPLNSSYPLNIVQQTHIAKYKNICL